MAHPSPLGEISLPTRAACISIGNPINPTEPVSNLSKRLNNLTDATDFFNGSIGQSIDRINLSPKSTDLVSLSSESNEKMCHVYHSHKAREELSGRYHLLPAGESTEFSYIMLEPTDESTDHLLPGQIGHPFDRIRASSESISQSTELGVSSDSVELLPGPEDALPLEELTSFKPLNTKLSFAIADIFGHHKNMFSNNTDSSPFETVGFPLGNRFFLKSFRRCPFCTDLSIIWEEEDE